MLAEIGFGIERAAGAQRRAQLHGWLTHPLRPLCAARVPLLNPWDAIA